MVAGGTQAPAFEKGYFAQPAVLGVKASDMLAQDEIFGPVLLVIPYQNDDEAVALPTTPSMVWAAPSGVTTTNARPEWHGLFAPARST